MSNARTLNVFVEFQHPFKLPGIDEAQPPGRYAVEIDEEAVQDISFLAYRRTGAWMSLSDSTAPLGSVERVWVDPHALDEALARDVREAGRGT